GSTMLQQILQDMWVDPEILAELDETQKQTLFCKMREEQVRRWQLWDQKVGTDEGRPTFQKNGKKQVQFMKGEDGEPWEARQRALTQAREEAHQLRKSVEKELTQLIDYQPMDSLEQIYCTVDELRQRIDALEPEVKTMEKVDLDDVSDNDKSDYCENMKLDINKNSLHFNFIEGKRDEIGTPNTGAGVSVKVAAWERRVAAARASDILRTLRARRAHATDHDEAWREQERKAKEAEATMRQIARAAREAHRRSADIASAQIPDDTQKATMRQIAREAHRRSADIASAQIPDDTHMDKPPSTDAVLEWFRTQELPRGVGFDEDSKPFDWFHVDLINYHRTVPMTESGGELLQSPCAPLKPLILSAPPPS
ncbi:SH2 domain-containing protein 4A, partial [Operophtera brumata]